MENKTGDKNIFQRVAAALTPAPKKKAAGPSPEEIAKLQAEYQKNQTEWLRIDNDELFRPIGQWRF